MRDSTIIYSDISMNSPAILTNLAAVQQGIEFLLNVSQGERLFRPTFGADLEQVLHELGNDDSEAMIYHNIHKSLKDETRVRLTGKTSILYDANAHVYDLELWFSVDGIQDGALNYNGALSRSKE